jgi:hypothetical protein
MIEGGAHISDRRVIKSRLLLTYRDASDMRSRFPIKNSLLKQVALVLAIGVGCAVNAAQAEGAAALADGAPWDMRNADGRNGTLVLRPDGSGEMAMGIITIRLTWDATGDELCIDTRMRGRQCMILAEQGAGFVGEQDGETVFWFSRSNG